MDDIDDILHWASLGGTHAAACAAAGLQPAREAATVRDDVVKVSGTTPAQRGVWRARAQEAGLPTAAWLREAADAVAAAGTTAADLRAELVHLRADLARGVGNNINQVAHALNADLKRGVQPTAAPHERSLAAAAADIAAARRVLERMLRRLEHPPRRRAT